MATRTRRKTGSNDADRTFIATNLPATQPGMPSETKRLKHYGHLLVTRFGSHPAFRLMFEANIAQRKYRRSLSVPVPPFTKA